MIINYSDKEVREELQNYLKQHPDEFCTCQQCREDIIALTLNQIPPHYVTSHRGEVITDFIFTEPLDHTKVLTALLKSIEVVSKSPTHPEGEPYDGD